MPPPDGRSDVIRSIAFNCASSFWARRFPLTLWQNRRRRGRAVATCEWPTKEVQAARSRVGDPPLLWFDPVSPRSRRRQKLIVEMGGTLGHAALVAVIFVSLLYVGSACRFRPGRRLTLLRRCSPKLPSA